MTGPNQSIMAFFTWAGQGAAPCMIQRIELTS
jgi:hypothetical protein